MTAFYNEIDPCACAWLRELMREGLITQGVIDERPIQEIKPNDLAGFERVHLFAGIAGWDLALNLAGWTGPVWTGSCPCQPFSCAGKRRGASDERHLWPEFFRLVKACRPATIFGEQVASAEVVGTELEAAFVVAVQGGNFALANRLAHRLARSSSLHFTERWLDGISRNLESENYALGAAIVGAHSFGSPSIRQRLYFVAHTTSPRCNPEGIGPVLGDQWGGQRGLEPGRGPGRVGHPPECGDGQSGPCVGRYGETGRSSAWSDSVWQPCLDGKSRRIPAGAQSVLQRLSSRLPEGVDAVSLASLGFPLAPKIPGRGHLLNGYGNSLCVPTAAAFITACLPSGN